MSLARAWRRQLYGASSAAMIVPSAMLAAVIVLALGGGFGQVGVLGQIFAGPPAPSGSGGLSPGRGAATVARSLPALPAVALRPSTPGTRHRVAPVAPVGSGARRSGAALAPVGGAVPIAANGGSTPARPAPTGSVPSAPVPTGPAASAPSPPAPQPSPKPTVVDQVIKVVTPVTQQLPAPAGPAVTQAVQAAGSAADGLLPPGLGSGAPAQGTALP
jgi:hypothetical protein